MGAIFNCETGMRRNTPFTWTCPYCGQPATITDVNYDFEVSSYVVTAGRNPDFSLHSEAIYCPNPECQQLTLRSALHKHGWVEYVGTRHWEPKDRIDTWNLMPASQAKPMPEYVPEEIRNSYKEACLILDLSPKASAAMSRRCLQGMVRDRWNIPNSKRGNLAAEINYIEDKVDPDTFASIHAVREVGNIGAHMEKSVDTIVDVDPGEAALLVGLIETLIDDWYVARHKRNQRNEALRGMVQRKRDARKQANESPKPMEQKTDEPDES